MEVGPQAFQDYWTRQVTCMQIVTSVVMGGTEDLQLNHLIDPNLTEHLKE